MGCDLIDGEFSSIVALANAATPTVGTMRMNSP